MADDNARGGTWEGLGGPVRMDAVNMAGLDPTLDSCSQREVRTVYSIVVYDMYMYITTTLCH